MITLDMDERLEYAQYIICLDYSVVSEYTCTHQLVHEMSEVLLEKECMSVSKHQILVLNIRLRYLVCIFRRPTVSGRTRSRLLVPVRYRYRYRLNITRYGVVDGIR